jgi:hypothetical protein
MVRGTEGRRGAGTSACERSSAEPGLKLAMRVRSLLRTRCYAAACGLLAMAIPVAADTAPQASAQNSKKKPVHHLASTSKTAKHRSASHSNAGPTSAHQARHGRSKGKTKSRKRGQQAIDSARARQIQEALIREHYLQGGPSGNWDSETQSAMQRYQVDQGWQSKTIPDARALIKLGLGPSPEHLLNPESAMTTSVISASTKRDSKSNTDDPPASPSGQSPSGDPPQR